ncbi:hypothetical protein NXW75_17060 [Bacteroides xylanisolvens]|nr:hypothetical protein [Bacteroides xylanisolvens]
MKIIILHDADARIEYLDVADHLIGSDIEEFLTRQGFSVNNITWLVTSADHIPSGLPQVRHRPQDRRGDSHPTRGGT